MRLWLTERGSQSSDGGVGLTSIGAVVATAAGAVAAAWWSVTVDLANEVGDNASKGGLAKGRL